MPNRRSTPVPAARTEGRLESDTRTEHDRAKTRPAQTSRSRRSPRPSDHRERIKLGSLAALIQARSQQAVTASTSTLGDRLLYLIARTGQTYTYQSLTAAINDHYRLSHPGAADVFSYTYIYHLISGAKSEPNERRRRALADFFGVHEALLFTDTLFADSFASTTAETARLTQVLKDARLRALALALPSIPPEDLDRLEPLIYRLTQGPLREFDSPLTPPFTPSSTSATPIDSNDGAQTSPSQDHQPSQPVPMP